MSTTTNTWELLELMAECYEVASYASDEADDQLVAELKAEAELMLSKANVWQLYYELTQYFCLPTPSGNMDPSYATANLWEIGYGMFMRSGRIDFYRLYVPFDGEPGVREYVSHCAATHEWFKDPEDDSLPLKESFHKR